MSSARIPVIDIAPLLARDPAGSARVAAQIRRACTDVGFFYVRNYEAVAPRSDTDRLETLARAIFTQPTEAKMRIAKAHSGLHWKWYFPSGDELTSGMPDAKEHIGEEAT